MPKPNKEAMLALKLYRQKIYGTQATGDLIDWSEQAVTDAARLCSMARSLRRLQGTQIKRVYRLKPSIIDLAKSYGLQVKFSFLPDRISKTPRSTTIQFPDGEVTLW